MQKISALYLMNIILYSIITPLKYHVFENIVENGAFAFL